MKSILSRRPFPFRLPLKCTQSAGLSDLFNPAILCHTDKAPPEGDGMTCPGCQQENPPRARFCMKCGAGLTLSCARCKTELPTGAAFCFACGQAVATAPSGQRFTAPDAYTPKH